jgi:hypothetical protein
MSADYIRAVPTINLTDDELAAVTAAVPRAVEDDRYPRAPRLDPLRAALARLEAATAADTHERIKTKPDLHPKSRGLPKPTSGRGDNRPPICRWRGRGTARRLETSSIFEEVGIRSVRTP